MSITRAIIPAAGFGTRFLPATKSQPKEMLPIVDTPVIQLLVEEAVSAGITDITIVVSRGKESIIDHFDSNFELEALLSKKWKIKELEMIQKLHTMARISYVRQSEPRWDGDAILQAKNLVGDEPVLVLFWDDIIRWEKTGAQQLVEAYEKYEAPVIALERISDSQVSSYGVIEGDEKEAGIFEISRFLEKPNPDETDSRLGVIGKYIITPEVFQKLENGKSIASKDGENRLADAFAQMKRLYGVEMQGNRYDTGDKFGFVKATIDFALARDDIGEKVKDFIKERAQSL